jgi:hypothetical protein
MSGKVYWIRIGNDELGPKSLEVMRSAVRAGEVGRHHEVSTDGETWRPAEKFPELFHVQNASPDDRAGVQDVEDVPPVESSRYYRDPAQEPQSYQNGEQWQAAKANESRNAIGLAGFICSVTGAALLVVPLTIFLLRVEAVYFLVPLAIPLSLVVVTGLILSVAGMMKTRRVFATSGMIVGVVGLLVGLITIIGWLVVDPPGDRWINEVIRAAQTDIEREEMEFQTALDFYQNPPAEAVGTQADRLNALTRAFMRLVRAYDEYVSATAIRMSKFRLAFRQLSELRLAYDEYAEALKLRDDIPPIDAIDLVGERPNAVKFLLDMLMLYQQKQITIEQAQSKFNAVRATR